MEVPGSLTSAVLSFPVRSTSSMIEAEPTILPRFNKEIDKGYINHTLKTPHIYDNILTAC